MAGTTAADIDPRQLRIVIDEVPVIFLHHDAWTKAWDARVQGYAEIPDGRMRLERVWLGR